MKLVVQSRSGRVIAELDVSPDTAVKDLKKQLAKKPKMPQPVRQRLTLQPKAGEKSGQALDDSKHISDYALKDGSILLFKDLGPQIGYSTVFFLEYLGPLVVYPLFYLFPKVFYPGLPQPATHHFAQTVAVAYWSFHYSKRIAETFLVHKFGHATMPIFNLFKNCSYYWGSAAFVAYFVNHPLYTAPHFGELQTQVAFGLAMVMQLCNLWCHIILANLRAPGEKGYKIPRGFLFNYITCANYTTEIWGWILFSIGTQALPALIFTSMGGFQMAIWALQKHARLRKIFDGKEGRDKYPRRWVLFPPFL